MNSLVDNTLNNRIDEMLAASVSSGSEPDGFSVRLMPRRPVFPWLAAASVAVVFSVQGYLMARWLGKQDLGNIDYAAVFSVETFSGLVEGIHCSQPVFCLAIVLGLAGAIVTFLPEKQQILRFFQ
jgi:hypothetical protein